MFKFPFAFCLLFLSFVVFSQEINTISGKVSYNNKPISDVIVLLNINNITKNAVTNSDGVFVFSKLLLKRNDKGTLMIRHLGFEPLTKEFVNLEKSKFELNFERAKVNELKGVVLNTKNSTTQDAYKSIYTIDQNKFLKNASSEEVLKAVPTVSMKANTLYVDGKLEAIVFVDGIEYDTKDLINIPAENINKIEVINNPSARYGAEFKGAVINIVLKKKTEDAYKVNLRINKGFRNDFLSINPTISYKRNNLMLKNAFSFLSNQQAVDRITERNQENIYTLQQSGTISKIKQLYNDTKIQYSFSENSKLNFSGKIFGLFNQKNTNGSIADNNLTSYFNNNGTINSGSWNLNLVYNYNFNKNSILYFKGKHQESFNKNEFNYIFEDQSTLKNSIKTNTKETTMEMDFEKNQLSLFNKKMDFYSGAKCVFRDFDFPSNAFLLKQTIFNAFTDINTSISPQFSVMSGLSYDFTMNKNDLISTSYANVLPTLNLSYKFENKLKIKTGYSRRITRPNASNLNETPIYESPNTIWVGNSDLKPQLRNYTFISFNKSIKNTNLNFKIYSELINNAILESFTVNAENILIKKLENAAKSNSTGFNFSLNTTLFNKIDTNFDGGVSYDVFKSNLDNVFVKENRGYVYNYSLYLSTMFFKNKLNMSFDVFQNNPVYTLTNKFVTNPSFNLSLRSNFFKDKITVNLTYSDMFALSTRSVEYSNATNFYQKSITDNKTTNLYIAISYNFGKKFNDEINIKSIENNDLKQ
jgi:hypothetical protein